VQTLLEAQTKAEQYGRGEEAKKYGEEIINLKNDLEQARKINQTREEDVKELNQKVQTLLEAQTKAVRWSKKARTRGVYERREPVGSTSDVR
jgi:hypothetical protein